jgi:hypothetical protein
LYGFYSTIFSAPISSTIGSILNLENKGVNVRIVTAITKDNINFCKEIMKVADVRNLGGIKGSFRLSEREYIATPLLQEVRPLPQLIYSNYNLLYNRILQVGKNTKNI